MALVLQPCGSDRALANFEQTVSAPISVDPVMDDLSSSELAEIMQHHPEGELRLWAIKSGPRNQRSFNTLRPGDTVVFGGKGRYFARGVVGAKFRNSVLGRSIWGKGTTESLFYTLNDVRALELAYEDLNPEIGRNAEAPPRAFTVLGLAKSKKALRIVEANVGPPNVVPQPPEPPLSPMAANAAAPHDLRQLDISAWAPPDLQRSYEAGRSVVRALVGDTEVVFERGQAVSGTWNTAMSISRFLGSARRSFSSNDFYNAKAVAFSWGLGTHLKLTMHNVLREYDYLGPDQFDRNYGFLRIFGLEGLSLVWQAMVDFPVDVDRIGMTPQSRRSRAGFAARDDVAVGSVMSFYDETASTPALLFRSAVRELLSDELAAHRLEAFGRKSPTHAQVLRQIELSSDVSPSATGMEVSPKVAKTVMADALRIAQLDRLEHLRALLQRTDVAASLAQRGAHE